MVMILAVVCVILMAFHIQLNEGNTLIVSGLLQDIIPLEPSVILHQNIGLTPIQTLALQYRLLNNIFMLIPVTLCLLSRQIPIIIGTMTFLYGAVHIFSIAGDLKQRQNVWILHMGDMTLTVCMDKL